MARVVDGQACAMRKLSHYNASTLSFMWRPHRRSLPQLSPKQRLAATCTQKLGRVPSPLAFLSLRMYHACNRTFVRISRMQQANRCAGRCNTWQVADRLRIRIRRRQMNEILRALILIAQLATSILRLFEEVRNMKKPPRG